MVRITSVIRPNPSAILPLSNRLNDRACPNSADNLGAGSVQSSLGLGSSPTHNEYLTWWNALVKNVPNIIATVHGHDHGNEWCARDPKSLVVLCFNKHTGYGGYDGPGWGHGVSPLLFRFLLHMSFLCPLP